MSDRMSTSGNVLECNDVRSYYGESYILHDVSIHVRKGELLALLGRNGAGKTTLLRSIAGAAPPVVRGGSIQLSGEEIAQLAPFEIARRGVSFVPEDRRIIPGLTVEENLRLAQVDGQIGWCVERIFDRFPKLAERRRQQGQTLSGGEQQMLAIARALARDTSLILLDEPYEGLAPQIVREVERILVEIKAEGITTLLVEQNAIAALKIADRCYIIDDGRVVHEATPTELWADEETRRRYLAV